MENGRQPQQALLQFSTLDGDLAGLLSACKPPLHIAASATCFPAGARIAQDSLWQTAEAVRNEWEWFLSDAETHVGLVTDVKFKLHSIAFAVWPDI